MFVWSSFVCFFLAYLVRSVRLWFLLGPLRFQFLPVAFSIVFSSAITIFLMVPWLGELSKWLFLGIVMSVSLMPIFVALVYVRFFDFLIMSLGVLLFSSGMPLVYPWVGAAFFIAVLILGFLLVGYLFNERISVYVQNRWYYLPFVKPILPILESKPSIVHLKLFQAKTLFYTVLFTILVWILEALGFYCLLSVAHYINIKEGVIYGLLNNVVTLIWFCDFSMNKSLGFVQQLRYESFDVPLFLIAIVFSALALRLWVLPKKQNG